jgi:2-hydroxymuconate-semialdehyde hydrolase
MGHDEHDHDHDQGHGHEHEHEHGHGGHGHGHDHAHGHAHEHGHAHAHVHQAHDHGHHGVEDEVAREKPFGPPRKVVEIGDGVKLSTIDAGEGTPILFLHGFPTSGGFFRKVIEAIGPRARCIAPDLLGFGASEGPPDAPLGLEAQADHVLRLLDKLEVAEAVVFGHDWGGVIAQILATRHTDRVARLVLCDSPAFDCPLAPVSRRLLLAARFSWLWDFVCDTGLLGAFARSARGFRGGAAVKEAITDEAIAEYLKPLFRDTPPAYRASRERFRRAMLSIYADHPAVTLSCAEGLRKLHKPTLVVWGCDDPYLSTSWAKKLADEIPGCARLELLAFCGHFVAEERPVELATLVAEFAELAPAASGAAVA